MSPGIFSLKDVHHYFSQALKVGSQVLVGDTVVFGRANCMPVEVAQLQLCIFNYCKKQACMYRRGDLGLSIICWLCLINKTFRVCMFILLKRLLI